MRSLRPDSSQGFLKPHDTGTSAENPFERWPVGRRRWTGKPQWQGLEMCAPCGCAQAKGHDTRREQAVSHLVLRKSRDWRKQESREWVDPERQVE